MIPMETAVERVKNGEAELFEVIIEGFQQQLFRYCYHMLGNKHEAEDAVQECFLKAFHKIGSYRESVSFSAWLYKIAYNHCINVIHRKNLLSFIPFAEETSTGNKGIESTLEDNGLCEPLFKALSKISKTDKSILLFKVLEEKSFEEISTIFGMKPATARKKYERARKKLKLLLEQKEGGILNEGYSIN